MSIPLKVSDGLYAVAKAEAAAAQRSITGQVEYWAKIGRAVEVLFPHDELRALTQAGETLVPLFTSDIRRNEVFAILDGIASNSPAANAARQALTAQLRATGQPLYETDPQYPDMVVQVAPDGTRTLGNVQNRQFVPTDPQPALTTK